MTAVDIFITLMIGVYVMVGGALLNASFTAPKNCKKFLDYITPDHHERLAQVGYPLAILIGALGIHNISKSSIFGNPAIWFALAHAGLALLLWLCRKIVNIVVEVEIAEPGQKH